MRLSIEHRTTYRFTAPQGRVVQMLRMTPDNTHDQTVADWHIAVDCDARMTHHRDGFGNATTMLYCAGPVEEIELTVTGDVVTSSSAGIVQGSNEVLPPSLFLRATPATAADAAITAFAQEVSGAADIAGLHRLNLAIHERYAADAGRPVQGLTAARAFDRPALTARDMTQIFIAGARALGAPARYVTGYCDLAGDHRPTPHGWAEAFVPDCGWIGFDPLLGLSPEEHHVRVAIALDAGGAAPVQGSRLGDGQERLDVDVTVQSEE